MKKILKITSIILIQAFLLMDFAWCDMDFSDNIRKDSRCLLSAKISLLSPLILEVFNANMRENLIEDLRQGRCPVAISDEHAQKCDNILTAVGLKPSAAARQNIYRVVVTQTLAREGRLERISEFDPDVYDDFEKILSFARLQGLLADEKWLSVICDIAAAAYIYAPNYRLRNFLEELSNLKEITVWDTSGFDLEFKERVKLLKDYTDMKIIGNIIVRRFNQGIDAKDEIEFGIKNAVAYEQVDPDTRELKRLDDLFEQVENNVFNESKKIRPINKNQCAMSFTDYRWYYNALGSRKPELDADIFSSIHRIIISGMMNGRERHDVRKLFCSYGLWNREKDQGILYQLRDFAQNKAALKMIADVAQAAYFYQPGYSPKGVFECVNSLRHVPVWKEKKYTVDVDILRTTEDFITIGQMVISLFKKGVDADKELKSAKEQLIGEGKVDLGVAAIKEINEFKQEIDDRVLPDLNAAGIQTSGEHRIRFEDWNTYVSLLKNMNIDPDIEAISNVHRIIAPGFNKDVSRFDHSHLFCKYKWYNRDSAQGMLYQLFTKGMLGGKHALKTISDMALLMSTKNLPARDMIEALINFKNEFWVDENKLKAVCSDSRLLKGSILLLVNSTDKKDVSSEQEKILDRVLGRLDENVISAAFVRGHALLIPVIKHILENEKNFNSLLVIAGKKVLSKQLAENPKYFLELLLSISENEARFNRLIELKKTALKQAAKSGFEHLYVLFEFVFTKGDNFIAQEGEIIAPGFCEDMLNVLSNAPQKFDQFLEALGSLIDESVVNKENYRYFSHVFNSLPGYNSLVFIKLFQKHRDFFNNLTQPQLLSCLDLYAEIGQRKGNLSGMIIEGLMESQAAGMVAAAPDEKEKKELFKFIEATNSFFAVLYDAYRKVPEELKEGYLNRLKSWREKMAVDGMGFEEIQEILDLNSHLTDLREKEELLMAVSFLTMPPLDTTHTTKKGVRPFFRNILFWFQVESVDRKDPRDDIPVAVKNFVSTPKELTLIRRRSALDDGGRKEYLNKLLSRLSEKDNEQEVNENKIVEKIIEFYQGRAGKSEVKNLIEAYLRNNPEFVNKIKALDNLPEHARWSKLHEIISDGLKHYLENILDKVKNKVNLLQEIKDIGRFIKNIKNPKLEVEKIKSILSQYSHKLLAEIKDEITTLSGDEITKERQSLIAGVIEELLREPEADLKVQGNLISLLYEEELEKLDAQAKSYTEDRSGSTSITYRVVNGLLYIVWGLNAGVCVGNDLNLFTDQNFILMPLFDEDNICRGVTYFYKTRDKLFFAGIHPDTQFLADKDADEVLLSSLEAAYEIAEKLGYDGFYIPSSESIHSNRQAIKTALKNLVEKLGLKAQPISEVAWQRYSSNYYINEVWEFDGRVKKELFSSKAKSNSGSAIDIKDVSRIVESAI